MVTRVTFTCPTRHDSTNQDCNEDTSQDQEQADLGDCGQPTVHKHYDECRQPCTSEVYDEDVPPLVCVSLVEEAVHGDDLIREDG
jgi:hypothetical protein